MIDLRSRNLRTATADVQPARFPRPQAGKGRVAAGWRLAGVAAAGAVALAGCSSFPSLTGDSPPPAPSPTASAPPSSNASFASRVKSWFSGGSANANAQASPFAASGGAEEIECPSVEYRQGAATMAINAPGAENTALSLRYQASFTQNARECILRGNDLIIKVGVQGRIVVGPAGAPGSINIPLRYALVREGITPKTLWTKLFTVPVAIPPNESNVPWLHVEEEMTVPRPSADELEAYVIYVGFDPEGAAPARPKPAAKPKAARPR